MSWEIPKENIITNEKYVHKSIKDIIKTIYMKSGIKGFYSGILMRSLQTSLCFGTYEVLNKYI